MARLAEVVVVVCAFLVCLSRAQDTARRAEIEVECESCNREECKIPVNCEAGLVKDKCGCCDVCGKKEFELCDHPQAPSLDGEYHGKCGENLECKLRVDLEEGDREQAVCYCTAKEDLCGSDGITYANLCQLVAASVRKNDRIKVQNKGPCKAAPKIVSKPENNKDIEGSNVALVCESTGYPIPTIEWTFTRVDGKVVYLPSDDLHISVNMRGGPERWQITGWLQVMEMEKAHEGDYTCIAQNELGVDQASARLNVITADGGQQKKRRRYKDQDF